MSERHIFGTDGARGVANADLSPELALALGAAAARVLRKRGGAGSEVIVGRDPRVSGDLLGAALVAGLLSEGVSATVIGVVPTPGVAHATRTRGALAGAVLSASHNPMRDNGIKFFGPDGRKLPDAVEAEIERAMGERDGEARPTGADVGRITRTTEPVDAYADYLAQSCGSVHLDGLRLVVDGANGAASALAPRVLEALGASVIAISCEPDGLNINENCGSTHPEAMAARVAAEGADAGLAFDGDADRVILADERGRIFDGDNILCALGIRRKQTGTLPEGCVVGTVMSNLGLEQALEKNGIRLLRAKVGDRYVLEEMTKANASVGGEQSGHVLLSDLSTTGDGLLTALQVLRLCAESGRSLSDWAGEMERLPQELVNIAVRDKTGWDTNPRIAAAIAETEQELAGTGRLLVRPSGTEKLIRVMAEAPTPEKVAEAVQRVAAVIRAELGG